MEKKIQTRRVLSLKERIDVITMAETLRDTRELSRLFDCGRTQILSILKQKDRLLKEWANNGDPNRLRRRPSAFSVAINKMVAEWIHRGRSARLPLTDQMIIDKAYQAKKFFKYGEFRPNKRWLGRFKRRFRLDGIDLVTPNTNYECNEIKSMKLSDIYEDIKGSLEAPINEAIARRRSSIDFKDFLMNENSYDTSPQAIQMEQSFYTSVNELSEENEDQSRSIESCYTSIKEICEENEDQSWPIESFCEAQIEDEQTDLTESSDAISSDTQALEYLKKLEEYSMLKNNFRAIGLLVQLERLYKGEIES